MARWRAPGLQKRRKPSGTVFSRNRFCHGGPEKSGPRATPGVHSDQLFEGEATCCDEQLRGRLKATSKCPRTS
eukprot:3172996-Pyramimonas_sp.AAC.1